MPKISYGPKVKERTRRFLAALLAYVENEGRDRDPLHQLDLQFTWQDEETDRPRLVVATKLRVLETLVAEDSLDGKLTKPQIREALHRLEDFLEILQDNRTQTQGKEDWRFTLSLWSTRPETNLQQFDREWQQRLPERAAGTEASPAIPPQFQALVEDKTEAFVGRDYIFAAIDDFLNRQPKGYFILEADPGVGKSAILAEYVRRSGCIAHFNLRSQGINRASQFLQSICEQLCDRYRLAYRPLPAEASRDGTFLARLLEEASNQLRGNQKLIVAVDALDEVDLDSQETGPNILYLPAYLPQGVYFILTRRKLTLPFAVQVPQRLLDLMTYVSESLQDIQTYIRRAIRRQRLQTWIQQRQLTSDIFIDQLAAKSENNFMYLRHVLPQIEDGFYQDLSIKIQTLPQGLRAYYQDHWSRMGMQTNPLPETKIKIVYILSEIRQPVSRQLIAEYATESQLAVQVVLDDWEQFLNEQLLEFQTCYSIYHSSFRDFLNRKEIVQAAGVSLPGINQMIADELWKGLFDDE